MPNFPSQSVSPSLSLDALTPQTVAALVLGRLAGDPDTTLKGVADIGQAEPGDLVFAESEKFFALALRSPASAILTTPQAAGAQAASDAPAKPLIFVENARLAFVQILEALAPKLSSAPGVHSSAIVDATAEMDASVSIAAHVTVGANVALEPGVVVMAGTRIGDGVRVGAGTVLHPNVVLYPGVTVGKGCILHAGCVIGADGFGYIPVGYVLRKVPQLGTVEIGDGVEIGANTCIDRAKTGVTKIGAGTKIDNLVHVAHNVTIGPSCLLIAQSGIAGSVTLGAGVILAGQAGVKDHVTLGDGARVGAQGGVIGDVSPGVTVSGYPARPHGEKMREYAATASLPDALKRLRVLEKRVAELEAKTENAPQGRQEEGKAEK